MTASNNAFNIITLASETEAAVVCADLLAQQIHDTLEHQSSASFFVSGGKSPAAVFDYLSRQDIPWDKTSIQLADERWAPGHLADQNQTLACEYLLQNNASSATFYPLLLTPDIHSNLKACNEQASKMPPPDIVLLGMGLDGHTASLFPDADDYNAAMQSRDCYVLVHPVSAPYPRISMSYHWLKQAGAIILFIPGIQKWNAFKRFVIENQDTSPLQQLMHDVGSHVTVIVTEGDA